MKLQYKFLAIIIPFLLLSLLGLGLWSVNEAKKSTYRSTYLYLSVVLESYVQKHVHEHYQLLKDAKLDEVASYVDKYQQEASNKAVEVSEGKGGHIFVLNDTGSVVFSSLNQNSIDIESRWKSPARMVASNSDGIYRGRLETDLNNEIFVAQHFKPWGWMVFYSISDEEIIALVNNILLATLGVMILCTLGGAILIYSFSNIILIRPIDILKDASSKIAKRETTGSIDIDSKDEIGLLARGIESMSRDIDQYQQELELHRNYLEEMVQSRTESLSEANEHLKIEVATRVRTEEKLYGSMEALQQSEEDLRTILDSIGDAVIAADISGKVIRLNPVGESLTGWKLEDSMGKSLSQVFDIRNAITGERAQNPVEKVLATGRLVGLANHTVLISKNGTEYQVADSAAPIRNSDGEITGVVLVFRDITEEHKMQEELQRMMQLKKIGTLAGGIAHDFNNILTGLFGHLSLAKANLPENHRSHKYLEASESSMKRATHLTSQLLTFAKGGAPIKEDISIHDLIEETAQFDLSGSNVMPVFKIELDLWTVAADKGQMQQVFSNLTLNANQAMPSGGHLYFTLENIEIKGDGPANIKAGKYVKITVRDEGIGISQKHIDRIFDPYFSTKQTGSGLGLATTYSIIRKHEGDIQVDSELGIGTTFVVYLPASERLPSTDEKMPAESSGTTRSIRILLMDDEEMICEIATEMLESIGHTVESVADGEAALRVYEQAIEDGKPFDVVIMDLTIRGGVGGKEAVVDILRIDPHAKVIVSSGYAADPVMANYADYGFTGVIAKPYTVDQIRQALVGFL